MLIYGEKKLRLIKNMSYRHSCNWTSWNNGTRICGTCGFIQYKDGSHIENDESRKMYVKWLNNE